MYLVVFWFIMRRWTEYILYIKAAWKSGEQNLIAVFLLIYNMETGSIIRIFIVDNFFSLMHGCVFGCSMAV